MNQTAPNYALTEEKIITESELKLIIKTIRPFKEMAERTKKNIHFINDYYLILVGSLCGLRASEISAIRIKDLNQNSIIIIGKGSKKRSVPLGRRGKKAVVEFLNLKRTVLKQQVDPDSFLFANRSSRPFSRFTINRRFRLWVKRCGVSQSLSWHSLRHYSATFMLNNGFLINEVKDFLGHSSIATTSVYLHHTKQTRERVDSIL